MLGQLGDLLDEHMNSLTPADIITGGDPKIALGHLQDARAAWRVRRQSEILDQAMFRAENSPQAVAGNMDNAIRTQFRQIANNPKRLGQFDKEAQVAILDVVKSDAPERALRLIAKFSPEQHPWTAVFGSVLASHFIPGAGLGVPMIGAIGNAMASGRTVKQAAKVGNIVRGGVGPTPKDRLAAALLPAATMGVQANRIIPEITVGLSPEERRKRELTQALAR